MVDSTKAPPPGEAPATEYKKPPAFYDAWQEREGIPVYKLFHVDDLMEVELGRWERFGVQGAFVNLADPFLTTAMVLEIGRASCRERV